MTPLAQVASGFWDVMAAVGVATTAYLVYRAIRAYIALHAMEERA